MTEPTATVNRGVSPLDAFTPAIEHTRKMLFEPFDALKWLTLGFVIFLAQLLNSDSSYWFSDAIGDRIERKQYSGGGGGASELQQFAQWCVDNVGLLVVFAVLGFLLLTVIGLLLTYLGARGHFMFLECVIEDKAEVVAPWKNANRPAWSFFLWRMALFLVFFWVTVLLLALPMWGILRAVAEKGFSGPAAFLSLIPFVAVILPLGLVFFLADLLIRDFVTPVMVLKRTDLLGSVEQARNLWRGNMGHLVLYLILRLVVYFIAGMVGFLVVLVTVPCCCLGALPVLHQTLTAPVHVFVRAWPLAIIEQFGPEWLSINRPAA